jgi:hypothetical protein
VADESGQEGRRIAVRYATRYSVESDDRKKPMILFLVGCVFVGIILAFFAAPIVVVLNRHKLKEMDSIIDDFHAGNFTGDKEEARRTAYAKLVAIKAGISSMDKQAVEAARDKLSLI